MMAACASPRSSPLETPGRRPTGPSGMPLRFPSWANSVRDPKMVKTEASSLSYNQRWALESSAYGQLHCFLRAEIEA